MHKISAKFCALSKEGHLRTR